MKNPQPQPQPQTFAAWMRAVDRILLQTCGLSSGDLGDQCFRDWYGDEVTPKDAAARVLEDEGFPGGAA